MNKPSDNSIEIIQFEKPSPLVGYYYVYIALKEIDCEYQEAVRWWKNRANKVYQDRKDHSQSNINTGTLEIPGSTNKYIDYIQFSEFGNGIEVRYEKKEKFGYNALTRTYNILSEIAYYASRIIKNSHYGIVNSYFYINTSHSRLKHDIGTYLIYKKNEMAFSEEIKRIDCIEFNHGDVSSFEIIKDWAFERGYKNACT